MGMFCGLLIVYLFEYQHNVLYWVLGIYLMVTCICVCVCVCLCVCVCVLCYWMPVCLSYWVIGWGLLGTIEYEFYWVLVVCLLIVVPLSVVFCVHISHSFSSKSSVFCFILDNYNSSHIFGVFLI